MFLAWGSSAGSKQSLKVIVFLTISVYDIVDLIALLTISPVSDLSVGDNRYYVRLCLITSC